MYRITNDLLSMKWKSNDFSSLHNDFSRFMIAIIQNLIKLHFHENHLITHSNCVLNSKMKLVLCSCAILQCTHRIWTSKNEVIDCNLMQNVKQYLITFLLASILFARNDDHHHACCHLWQSLETNRRRKTTQKWKKQPFIEDLIFLLCFYLLFIRIKFSFILWLLPALRCCTFVPKSICFNYIKLQVNWNCPMEKERQRDSNGI